MRCNKQNLLAAIGGLVILAMPIAANAQALGVRVGNLGVGVGSSGITTSGLGLGGATTGLTGLSSGLVTTNAGAITSNVLGGGSVLGTGIAPLSANIGNGLVTINNASVNANVLGGSNIANVSTGGPLAVSLGGIDSNVPVIPVGPDTNVTLGADRFFSSNTTSWRMNGGGSGGGGGGGGSQGSEGGSAESSSQVCERVLKRPGSFSRAAVSQCRRVVASVAGRR